MCVEYTISDDSVDVRTNVNTDAGECVNAGAFIDQLTNRLYVAYNGSDDGSQTHHHRHLL